MSIYDCETWIKDIDEILYTIPWISDLSGKSIMITGASGLVCSAIVDILIRYNESHIEPIQIIAAGRSRNKITERFDRYSFSPYFKIIEYDATKTKLDIANRVDFIIHGASNSSPDMISKEPVETMLSNFFGLHSLLRYAKDNAVNRILYISSSEVYGKKESNKPFQENQYGFVDLLIPRNSYAVGKRAAETLCISYSDEYGVESVIVRPGHIYGPTAMITDKHVSSQWAYDAANGKNIVMKSNGTQLRSYCYCLDSAAAIITALIKGENCHAYNISNPNSVISIRQMAEILSSCAESELKIELANEEEKKTFNPMDNSSLDSSALIKLGWKGMFDAETGLSHTVEILKELR